MSRIAAFFFVLVATPAAMADLTIAACWNNACNQVTISGSCGTGTGQINITGLGPNLSTTCSAGSYSVTIGAADGDVGTTVTVSQSGCAAVTVDVPAKSTTCVGDFDRGDCNQDGNFNIADAVFLLGSLFPPAGGMPNVLDCQNACDANDDGSLNIADAVAALSALFPPLGSPPAGLPAPFGACGADPTPSLDCLVPTCP